MKQIMLPSINLLVSSTLKTTNFSYTEPQILRKLQIVILPHTVQRIKNEDCHLSSFTSVQLSDVLSFHHDMETFLPCVNILPYQGLQKIQRMYPRLLSPYVPGCIYDLFLYTNGTSFNWHLLTALWFGLGFFSWWGGLN